MNFSSMQIPRIKIPIRVVAFLLAVLGAAFLYWTNGTKVPEVEKETTDLTNRNADLKQKENNLTMLYNSMPFYLEEIDRLKLEAETMLDEFPTYMYLEDKIMYSDTLLKTDLRGYNLESFNYGASSYIMSVSYGGSEDNMLDLYSVNLSGKYSDLTYKQVKELLDYGLTSSQRFVMQSIKMGYNEETGYLSGDISFSTYFISGQEEPYDFPVTVVDGMGDSNRVDDLFGARVQPQPTEPEVEEQTEETN